MELKRWTQNDPEDSRCDFVLNNASQCGNLAEPNCNRCALHGANKILQAQENRSLRLYKLAKWQARANEITDHDKLKSLREEIAILRILIEERIGQCNDSHDLLLMSGPLSDLIMKVEKVVSSCNKLENNLGDLLDKQKVKNLASLFMSVIVKRLEEYAQAHNLAKEEVSTLIEAIANDFLTYLEENQ